jgi:hypothetical protein
LIGTPLRALTIPPTSQTPKSACDTALAPLPHSAPYRRGSRRAG